VGVRAVGGRDGGVGEVVEGEEDGGEVGGEGWGGEGGAEG